MLHAFFERSANPLPVNYHIRLAIKTLLVLEEVPSYSFALLRFMMLMMAIVILFLHCLRYVVLGRSFRSASECPRRRCFSSDCLLTHSLLVLLASTLRQSFRTFIRNFASIMFPERILCSDPDPRFWSNFLQFLLPHLHNFVIIKHPFFVPFLRNVYLTLISRWVPSPC